MNILDRIVAYKQIEVAAQEKTVPLALLQQQPAYHRKTNSLCEAIRTGTGIIAEFKRKSPSKGIINDKLSPQEVTQGYVKAGASGLSVLTDVHFFGGSPQDLQIARLYNPTTPILRKEFVINAYQLHEAKAMGADVILLIAACLSPAQSTELAALAHELGLEVLLEVHDLAELQAHAHIGADLIGVNNRNLKTFEVDLNISAELAPKIPAKAIKVAESGIHTHQEMEWLKKVGFQGFLIGESFMKTANPEVALAEFLKPVGV